MMTTRRTKMSLARRLTTLRDLYDTTRSDDALRRSVLMHHIEVCERAQDWQHMTAEARLYMDIRRAFTFSTN